MSDTELGIALLRLARGAIAERFGNDSRDSVGPEALREPGATFVTLTQRGELRGCIGSLEAYRLLASDVRENAVAAAFHDPRFAPLSEAEFEVTSVEVSLLTPAQEITFADEEDLLTQLRPRVDGIVLRCGQHRSTFLPQVWETLPDPRSFISQLKRKAGLPANFWTPDMSVSRYEVSKWKESDFPTSR